MDPLAPAHPPPPSPPPSYAYARGAPWVGAPQQAQVQGLVPAPQWGGMLAASQGMPALAASQGMPALPSIPAFGGAAQVAPQAAAAAFAAMQRGWTEQQAQYMQHAQAHATQQAAAAAAAAARHSAQLAVAAQPAKGAGDQEVPKRDQKPEVKPLAAHELLPCGRPRCRRTDGKRWRCMQPCVAGHNYCAKHVHVKSRKQSASASVGAASAARQTANAPTGKAGEQAPSTANSAGRSKRSRSDSEARSGETETDAGGSAFNGGSPRTVLKRSGAKATATSKARSASPCSTIEACRCRRTDGKNWRCSKDAVPGHNFCEKHLAHMARSHAKRRRSAAIAATAKVVEAGLSISGKDFGQAVDPAVPLLLLLSHERDHEVPEIETQQDDTPHAALARAAAAEVPSAA